MSSATYLLDANVLIALAVREHEHHPRVVRWVADVRSVAICPIVEGALARFLVRLGESSRAVAATLRAFYDDARCEFWPDSVSYGVADLSRVVGHRQVTDAYLVALAVAQGGRLATLDRSLASEYPNVAELIL